ncbi:helix-turn-helix domain-containing protein [Niallia oryzisoli]|uniref:helix-turn-helix domain-containing protein n=1 Tax=Niallia oryzisoli TaxID=1737571 RepID=UPI0037367C67
MDRLKDSLRVFVVPTEILDMEELDVYEKMTYMVLRSYANGHDDTAFPSYSTIAKKGSMGRKKAIECVNKLVELKLVVKEVRKKVSKNNGISQTSNLYTIYRPAEVKNKGDVLRPNISQTSPLVSDEHHPSVPQTPPLVSDEHHPSVPQTPENNYLKELDLKESFNSMCSEESEIYSLLELRSDINIQTHKQIVTLLNKVKRKDSFDYSIFKSTLNKVDFDIQDMNYFKRALTNNLKSGYVFPTTIKKGFTGNGMIPEWYEQKENKQRKEWKEARPAMKKLFDKRAKMAVSETINEKEKKRIEIEKMFEKLHEPKD